jgi:PST family polysaccharide transporter
MKKLTILKAFSWVAFGNVITKPLWMLLIIFAAKKLGSEQFGIYYYALSIVLLATIIVDFGFDYILIQRIAKNKNKLSNYLSAISFYRIVNFIIVLIFLSILNLFFPRESGIQTKAIIILLFFQFTVITLTSIKNSISAIERFSAFSQMMIFEKGLLTLFGFVSLWLFPDIISFLSALLIANFLTIVFLIVILFKKFDFRIVKPTKILLVEILRDSFPLLLMNIFVMIYFRIDVVLLNHFLNNKEIIGIYGSIHRIIEMFLLIPSILMSTFYPIIIRLYDENKTRAFQIVDTVIKVMLSTSIVIALIFTVYAFELNKFMFGQEYIEGYRGLKYIIWTIVPLGINFILGYLLISINKQKFLAITLFIASVVNITLNVFLIPKLSFVGTSITALVTEIIIFIFYSYFSIKYFGNTKLFASVSKFILLLIIFYFSFNGLLLLGVVKWLTFILSMLFMFVIAFVLKIYGKEDYKIIVNKI